MKAWIVAACLLCTIPARADVVVVLTEAERSALMFALGASLQAQPQLGANIYAIFNKLISAPTMTSQKEIKTDDPAKEASPKKDDVP